MTQEVHGLIGCPGSGKTTLANKYDPTQWVICTFDDLRQAMWPPHRRTYWDVRKTAAGPAAQKVLYHVQRSVITAALENGFSLLSADTNTEFEYAEDIMKIADIFGLKVHWKVLDVPLHVLRQRNAARCKDSMQVPDEVLIAKYEKLWANDAWWRTYDVEIIKYHPTEISEDESVATALNKLIKDHPMIADKAKEQNGQYYRTMFSTLLSANLVTDKDIINQIVNKHFGFGNE